MKRLVRFVGTAGLALAALAPTVSTQACFPPDGLDGPCAMPVDDNLPDFPALTLNGSTLRWTDCIPDPKVKIAMMLSAPVEITCGAYFADFTAFDPISGTLLAAGTLELTYSRTWDELDPAGNPHQVWRFLAMGELDTPPGPPLMPADLPSFYHGYLDYALACPPGGPPFWEHALVLHHNCDDFLHRPGISVVPGVFDPVTTYGFVAPDTAANPFDPTFIPLPLMGPAVTGALRDPFPIPGAPGCCTRDRIVQAGLQLITEGCACPLSSALPPRNAATAMTAFGACGSGTISFDTVPIGFPWLHMVSTAIGRWTTPFGYPGDETARVTEGPVIWQESCSPQRFVELHYGGETNEGWEHISPLPVVMPRGMYDTRSNWSTPIPGPIPLPLVGAVFPAPEHRHVLYLDLF